MKFIRHTREADIYRSMILNVISLILYLNAFIAIAAVNYHDADANDTTFHLVKGRDVCSTPACREIATEMTQSMEDYRTPCEDFYCNACLNWYLHVRVPDNVPAIEWDQSLRRRNDIQRRFEELLTSNLNDRSSTAIWKAKQFFASCANTNAIDAANMKPIINLVRRNGGWPLSLPSGEWNRTKFTIQEIHENYAINAAVSALFVINSDYPNQFLRGPKLSIEIPRIHVENRPYEELYNNKTWRNNYMEYMVYLSRSIADNTGKFVLRNETERAALKVIALERQLFNISKNERSPSQRPISIKTLQNKWDRAVRGNNKLSINWLDVIRGRVEGSKLKIDQSTLVILSPATFIVDLVTAIQGNSLITIVNYVHWKVIENLLRYTSRTMRQVQSEWKEKLFGPHYLKRRVPLSPCITDGLKHAAHYLFVNTYHNDESKKIMTEMREEIRHAIQADIQSENVSFDKRVTETLIEALKSINVSVNYPKLYEDSSALDKYYEKLSIGTNHFRNALAVRKFRVTAGFNYLKNRQDQKGYAFMLPPTGDTELHDDTNSTLFPIGNLPPPEINPELPMAINYARAGTAIGHEMVYLLFKHFEYIFHDYSTNQIVFWAESRIQKYRLRLQEFVDQYSSYAGGYNGTTRVDEYIPDLGGVKAAFKAYKTAKSKGIIKSKILADFLPQLSDEHLFFYAYANNFCESNALTGYLRKEIDLTHSWGRIRLFIPVLNMKNFLRLFNCSSRTTLNAFV